MAMTKQIVVVTIGILTGCLTIGAAEQSIIGVGVRQYSNSTMIEKLGVEKGDLAYSVSYQVADQAGYWELALDYCPSPTGSNSVESTLTPQINLLFSDGPWRIGLGLLKSYIEGPDDLSGWQSVNWQGILGLRFPFGRLLFDIKAYYVVDSFGDVTGFDFSDIEYGAWLNYPL